jgi:predicted acyl esterase
MNKKLVGIFVCMLLVITAQPVIGNTNTHTIDLELSKLTNLLEYPLYTKETYMVPMRDGIELATDVYIPDNFTDPHGSILIRTPYNKNNIEQYLEGQDYYLEQWVDEYGWPFVVQDERGLYASQGEPVIFPGGEYYDGYDTVEWIASQSFSNGKIATWGRSAFGENQYVLAGSNPLNLACQYVGVATSNSHKDNCYPGGQLRKYLLENWLDPDDFEFICANENYTQEVWGNVSLEDKWQNISVPAIHIGGWYDMTAQGTIDAFVGYNYKGGQGALGKSKLVMGPWTHTQFGYNKSKTGDLTFPLNQHDIFSRYMFHDMIKQYIMDDTDEPFDKWPTVSYYVMSDVDDTTAPGNEWRYADGWPIPGNEIKLYFHEGEVLSQEIPGTNSPLNFSYDPTDPVPTLGGQNLLLFQGPKDQRSIENREDVLLFTTEALTEPFESTGPVKARLYVSSDCVDTDFTVKLTDVYPDGRSMLIADGILRMRNRNGSDYWEFIIPDEIYDVEVDLWSTSYIWNTGHKIRVAISSSNYPRFLANPNTDQGILDFMNNPVYITAENSIYIDDDHPSCIIFQKPFVAPDKPIVNGPSEGKKDKEITFNIVSNDPEEDDIFYYIDWGDGEVEEWIGPFNSGEEATFTHIWTDTNKYIISARAKDVNGLWSDIEIIEINIPRTKTTTKIMWYHWLLERFPLLEKLLTFLLL